MRALGADNSQGESTVHLAASLCMLTQNPRYIEALATIFTIRIEVLKGGRCLSITMLELVDCTYASPTLDQCDIAYAIYLN